MFFEHLFFQLARIEETICDQIESKIRTMMLKEVLKEAKRAEKEAKEQKAPEVDNTSPEGMLFCF